MTSDTTLTQPGTVPSSRIGMTSSRKIALWGGLLYLLTFAASLPQLALFADLIDDPTGYITSPGSDTAVQLGAWLEIVTALAGVGTAVALYPITRRVSRSAAIGFVTSRVVEAGVIFAGVMSVLAVVTLRGEYAGAVGAEETAVGVTGEALVAMRQATFLIGPGIMPAINAFFLGYALHRSRLVPRILPTVGLIGAPLLLASATVVMFGGWSQTSPASAALTLPIALWEFALGVYLTVKGFRPSPVTDAVDAAGAYPRRTS
jgi:hypothetical protein